MKMKWGNHQIKYCNNIAYIKWMYDKILMLFGDNIDNIGSKSDVTKKQRDLATKISVSCLQAINIYNLYMDGVDLMDQLKSVYQLLTTSFLPFAWCCTHKSFHYLQKARKYRTYSKWFQTIHFWKDNCFICNQKNYFLTIQEFSKISSRSWLIII